METKLRWGYIGSGSIAATVAMNTVPHGHKITCVYSRNKETAAKSAEKYGARVCLSLDELLESDEVDAVYIATPHTSHKMYSLEALKKGKPVLCEKPVGINSKEVKEIIACAKDNGTYFCEAMWTWFSDMALQIERLIKEKKIGDIKAVKISYSFPGILKAPTSRVRDPKTAGGALLDIGIYPITYCYRLFGYPEKIMCKGTVKDGIDVKEKIILSYDGFDCEINVSLFKASESMKIIGSDGKIDIPLFHVARLATLKNKDGREVFTGKTDYATEFDRCSQEIKEGKKESSYIPFSQTLDCMKIMDECRRQMGLVYPCE